MRDHDRKWEKIGKIDVDAGLCWVGDRCYVLGVDASHGPKNWQELCSVLFNHTEHDEQGHSSPLGVGVAVQTGYGDGSYPVYIRRGHEGRIVGVMVAFDVDDEDDV